MHDLLQQFKTHPLVRDMLEGGERVAWGAKTIPEGGFLSLPRSLSVPGAVLTGDSAGFVNVPKLKGIHYAMRSGMLAADTIYERAEGRRRSPRRRCPRGYDRACSAARSGAICARVRNMRQALGQGNDAGRRRWAA